MPNPKRIQLFEHQHLVVDESYDGVAFEKHHYIALSKLNILHKGMYFDIRHNGIKAKQFVGVVQVDGLTIEILPKIDTMSDDKGMWQKVLIDMLRVTRRLKVQQAGEANVNRQNIHLLDIYFEYFLNEVQLLIRQGLIKQYRKKTGNVKSLKGKLEFAGHIRHNLVHKERFYTTHQVYDKDHLIHQVLGKALDIISVCTKASYLYGRCKQVQLDFPEVKDISVNRDTFSRISKSRKTAPYETALAIARLIILNYAPNITNGSEKMLALLFDMNSLWEEYILVRLKQACADTQVYGQHSKSFWNGISIRPDIVIKKGQQHFIIDTKWKNIGNSQPSTDDLRQLYVYNDYWKSTKAMLLYPSYKTEEPEFKRFNGLQEGHNHHECGLGKVCVFEPGTSVLNKNIGVEIIKWFD